jgi:hypothetical protein
MDRNTKIWQIHIERQTLWKQDSTFKRREVEALTRLVPLSMLHEGEAEDVLGRAKVAMNTDCDLRIANLVRKEVQRTLQESYGSVFLLEISSIKHEGDTVTVQGVFQRPFQPEMPFVVRMPGVDGPLDYFL